MGTATARRESASAAPAPARGLSLGFEPGSAVLEEVEAGEALGEGDEGLGARACRHWGLLTRSMTSWATVDLPAPGGPARATMALQKGGAQEAECAKNCTLSSLLKY